MSNTLPPPTPRPDGATVYASSRFAKDARTGGSGADGNPNSKQHRSWKRRTQIGAVVVVALLIIGVGGAYFYARWRYDQIKKVTIAGLTPRSGNDPFDILLVGSDSRAFVDDSSQAAQFGSAAQASGQRSDVIIIARVAPATHQIKLLSIPRDTWVDIPGKTDVSGPNKINAAFNSGPQLLVQTIKQSFGIPISDYAEVGFPGFSGMVNALGGIDLDFPYPVRDAFSQLKITHTGCQLVDGSQALALVRSRHLEYLDNGTWLSDPSSDWSRIQRQDAFFRALVPRMHGVATSPTGLNSLLGAMTSDLTIDRTLTEGVLISLGRTFRSVPSSSLDTETLPTVPSVVDGIDALIPAPGPDESLISSFLAFGSSSTSTTASTSASYSSSAPMTGIELTSDVSTQGPTVTTVAQAANPGAVVYNTTPEPWNPTPCTP